MKQKIQKTQTRIAVTRGVRGQAIVEGVVATWLIVTVGISLVLLLFNVGLLFLYQDKINRVAQEAAKQIDAAHYWLGMERPDFEENKSKYEQHAQEIANGVASTLGIGAPKWEKPQYFQKTIAGRTVTMVKTRATVTNLQLLGGIKLPVYGVSGTGAACDNAWPPYCMMGMLIYNQGSDGTNNQFALVPAYGGLRHNGQALTSYSPSAISPNNFSGETKILYHCLQGPPDPGYPSNKLGFQIADLNGSLGRWSNNQAW